MSEQDIVSRRTVLKAGAAITATSVAGAVPLNVFALPPTGPRVFTREQYAAVDELTEILIPADDHSGGARAAGVAAYIDAVLAEEFDVQRKATFLAGLALVDAMAKERHGRKFMTLAPQEREAIVGVMAEGESDPKTAEARFFVDLKERTARGYYTSRVGIHDELNYKGNTLQEEYSGIDVSKL